MAIARVVVDVLANRSVVVAVPATLDVGELDLALRRALRAVGVAVDTVRAPELATGALAASLGDALDVRWASASTARVASALTDADGLPDAIQVTSIGGLTPTDQGAWRRFVENWARNAQARALRGARTAPLILTLPGTTLCDQPLQSNVLLAVHWWWGIPSAVEMRLLCRVWAGGRRAPAQTVWTEHVVPALAGNDVEFARDLCDVATELTEASLPERLRVLAAVRGWTTERLERAGARVVPSRQLDSPGGGADTSLPPLNRRALWALGALDSTPEFGIELHTLALAALGLDHLVRHRFWRGQASLLLPMLDSTRLAICDALTVRYGPEWPTCWIAPIDPRDAAAVRADPLVCSWGHLYTLAEARRISLNGSSPSWRDLIATARRARNDLAHYRAVDFATFARLWRACEYVGI